MSFLMPEILIIFILNVIILGFMLTSSAIAYKTLHQWDMDSTSQSQYLLEKKNRFTEIAVRYAAMIKFPCFFIFIYANNKLADVIPGAMCATGSLNATVYGKYLLYAMIADLYLCFIWLVVNHYNNLSEKLPYTLFKAKMIIIMAVLMMAELALYILNFANLDTSAVVSCCNTVFAPETDLLPSQWISAAIFTAIYTAMAIGYKKASLRIYSAANFIYFFVSVIALIQFTGIYIYELPTHHCPFCLTDNGYHHIGYLFYTFLFCGTAAGISVFVMHRLSGSIKKTLMRFSFFMNTLYLLLSWYYPLHFFSENHTWL